MGAHRFYLILFKAILFFNCLRYIGFCCISCILVQKLILYSFVQFDSPELLCVYVVIVADYFDYSCCDTDCSNTWRARFDMSIM